MRKLYCDFCKEEIKTIEKGEYYIWKIRIC